jgi:hypothetical protein
MKKIILGLLFSVGVLFSADSKMQILQPTSSTCPQSWLDDMKKLSNDVKIISMITVSNVKNDVGIPREIRSCNTTFFNDMVIEGNVPVEAIEDFLKNKPNEAIGLSLPSYENDKNPKTVYVIFEDKTFKEFGKY